MDQRVHFLSIATADLDAARAFYSDAMGWTPQLDVPGEIVFYQVAPGMLLGFFEADKFNQDLDDGRDRSVPSGFTVAHNLDSPEAVTDLVETMRSAGGTVLKSPQPGAFGGIFHAHVQDPNGLIWEIAHNPGWRIEDDGSIVLE